MAEHRQEKVLGLLEHLWKYEGSRYISGNDVLMSEIRNMNASKLCGLRADVPLHKTWLPLQQLQRQCFCFMEESEPFPFLKLEEAITAGGIDEKWMFLHTHFGVRKDEDADLLLDILRWIKIAKKDPSASPLPRPERLANLYEAIGAKCKNSAHAEAVTKHIGK